MPRLLLNSPAISSMLRHRVRGLCVGLALLTGIGLAAESPKVALGLNYPVGGQGMPSPTGVYVDGRSGEIYVTDGTTERVVIFDGLGRYNYEFKTRGRLSAPRQVAVDSLGRILVLGDPRWHTLAQYDYNGDFLRYLDLRAPGSDSLIEAASFVLDAQDRLFVLCARPAHIYVFTASGEFTGDFPILEEMDRETRESPVLGNLAVVDTMLVIPLSMAQQVARYTKSGQFVSAFGMPGGAPGELSFPVAVSSDGVGGMFVLDKHRHTVLQYDGNGKYLREFGGLGQSIGWFYHPTTLALGKGGECLVGQTFRNRVQSMRFDNGTAAAGLSTKNP